MHERGRQTETYRPQNGTPYMDTNRRNRVQRCRPKNATFRASALPHVMSSPSECTYMVAVNWLRRSSVRCARKLQRRSVGSLCLIRPILEQGVLDWSVSLVFCRAEVGMMYAVSSVRCLLQCAVAGDTLLRLRRYGHPSHRCGAVRCGVTAGCSRGLLLPNRTRLRQ